MVELGAPRERQDYNWKEEVLVDDMKVTVKLDTGAEINVLPIRYVRNVEDIKNTLKIRLRIYGEHIIRPIGTVLLKQITFPSI